MASPASLRAPPRERLEVAIRAEPNGPPVAFEPVSDHDLVDCQSELWWHGWLRRGAVTTDLRALSFECDSSRGDEAEFVLTAADGAGRTVSRRFSRAALSHVARRRALALDAAGRLGDDGLYYYSLRFAAAAAAEPVESVGQLLGRKSGLAFAELPLDGLLEGAEQRGATGDGQHHVVFTAEALALAERIARTGERQTPPVETGGVLVGSLCRCPDSGVAFVAVTDAIEASDAEAGEFSLRFTSDTWTRIQAVVRARQSNPATRRDRIIGQVHGHPFSPGEPCAQCAATPDCPKHTAFLSTDDLHWSRAVFSAQPWQLGLIYGVDARGRGRSTLYGLHGGRLTPRGFSVVARRQFDRFVAADRHTEGAHE